jgi:hypothetical protein
VILTGIEKYANARNFIRTTVLHLTKSRKYLLFGENLQILWKKLDVASFGPALSCSAELQFIVKIKNQQNLFW